MKYLHQHNLFDCHPSRDSIHEAFRAKISLDVVLLHLC